jgi:hypothetical protein
MRNSFIWIILALIAVAFTWHVVAWSQQHGKLAMPPDYDDSHSFVEGAVRLLNFQEHGWRAAWDEYRLRNPHSFLHYYWTAVLFAVFGIHEAVPYWANALFLFGVLGAFVSMLPRGLPIAWKLVWAAAFLGVPVCFHVIFDFRSEVTMAALLFMGCACALEWAWGKMHSTAWFFATALCFALALAMKPVMFPYQLGMLGLCSMVYLASRFFVGKVEALTVRAPDPLGPKLVKASLCLSALWTLVLLPSLPHFWIYRADIFGYILGVAFESNFYKLNEKQGAQWSFHWLGYSGVWHLGGLNVLLMLLVGIGLFCRFAAKLRKFAPEPRWVAVAFLMFGAFAGIAVNAVHQPWFGMTFQLLLVTAALSFLATLSMNPHLPIWVWPTFILALSIMWLPAIINRWFLLACFVSSVIPLVCAFVFRGSLKHTVPLVCSIVFGLLCWRTTQVAPYHKYADRTFQEEGEMGLEWRRNGPSQVMEVLAADWRDSRAPVIWCANYGWVDGNTISWEALKQELAWKVYNMGTIFGRKQTPSPELPQYADYLVVPSPGITGEIMTPNGITDWNSEILTKTNWKLVDIVKAPKGDVAIYRNWVPVEKRDFSDAAEWIQFIFSRRD